MLTLRLGGRLILGSGRDGLARWALTALGVAVVVFALVLTWKIPQVVSAGVTRAEDRAPVSSKESEAELRVGVLQDALGGRVRTRVLISDVNPGTSPPPGLSHLPEPGEVFRSPAWTAAEGQASGQVGVVTPPGLTDPDEYVEYVGVADDAQIGRPASGFGVSQPGAWVSVTAEKLMFIQLLLLAVPLGGYLLVASRLSAESRRRRMASLSLLGMDDAQVVKVSSLETVVHTATGALLGFGSFVLLAPVLGQRGLLGMRWFAGDVTLGTVEAVVVSLLVIVASVLLSVGGSRRLLNAPLTNRLDDAPARLSWWRWLPLAIGLSLLAAFVVSAASSSGNSAPRGGTGVLLVGTAFAVAGLVLSSRSLLRRAAAAVPADSWPLSIRLAARRIEALPGVTMRVLATLLLMVLVGALGTAVLEVARAATGPQGDTLTLFLASESADSQAVGAAAAAGAPIAQATLATSRPTAGSAPTDVIWSDCEQAEVIIERDLKGCQEGRTYRLLGGPDEVAQWGGGLAAVGDQVEFAGGEEVRVPAKAIRVEDWGSTALSPSTVLIAQSPVNAAVPPGSRSLVIIDNTPERAAEFLNGLRDKIPDAAVDALAVNTDGYETYRIYRGVVTLGIAMGLLLGVGGYALTAFDARRVARRNTAALLATGIPTGILRASQIWRDLLPLLGGLVLWGVTAVLVAFTYLELGDAPASSRGVVLKVVAGAALGTCLIVAVGGSILIERRILTPSNLRRE